MKTLFWLILTIGIAPLAIGIGLLKPTMRTRRPAAMVSWRSTLLCALSFNLMFFWQELWLVIPKALTPGLHPILYHNNHDWTGDALVVELLQGTGALATLVGGLACLAGLVALRRGSGNWRLFLFWMAFQGLYQSLTQLAIGSLLPGNDVGRALVYLQTGDLVRMLLLGSAVAAMALAGVTLARFYPGSTDRGATVRTRAFAVETVIPALAAIMLIIPFRLPRDMIEVGLIPSMVDLIGIGWLVLGGALARHRPIERVDQPAGMIGPALALGATLLIFQLVLRPGIAF